MAKDPDYPALEFPGYYDPLTVSERLYWALEHWKQDHAQPRDLDRLLLRAARTLETCRPGWWMWVAAGEAVLLIVCAILLHRVGW